MLANVFLQSVIQALSLSSELFPNWCVLVGEAKALAMTPSIHLSMIPIIHVNKHVKVHYCLVNKTQAKRCLASPLATQYHAYRAACGS